MEKLVCVNENYRIWQLDKESLHELAEFVVTENYKHHVGSFTAASIKAEVDSVFQEELQYIDSSIIFAVRNMMGKIIGSIRVFKWDRKKTLPVQKIFGVNPLSSIHTEVDYNYWHIGRFAIDSFSGILFYMEIGLVSSKNTILLFLHLHVIFINGEIERCL